MNKEKEKQIAIMDTTLRDGEQIPDIAYSAEEKLQLDESRYY
jgi:isopropylmalate/homocitrate/citramalate synthase